MSSVAERKMWGLRVTDAEKAEIRRRATEAGVSMTEYVLNAALGSRDELERRVQALEDRISRLERS